jgi:hypothetical protein
MADYEISPTLERQLHRVLADFQAPGAESGRRVVRVPIDRREAPVPRFLRFILMRCCGAKELPRGDKVAWEVGFRYRERWASLSLEKFGVRFYVAAQQESEAKELARDAIASLQRAISQLETQSLAPLARAQLEAAAVTLQNQHWPLRNRFDYFMDAAAAGFSTDSSSPQKGVAEGGTPDLAAMWNDEIHRLTAGSNNALAAVNAYFSLLEHDLVLSLPFLDFDVTDGGLRRFIGQRWGDKIKAIFDLSTEIDAHRHYELLRDAAESYRNTYGHGGFDKQGAAIYVHLPEIGAVPARLTDVRESPHFELFPVEEEGLTSLGATFDAVDAWLRRSSVRFGIRFAESALPVAFDPASRAEYRQAMAS